MKAMVMPRMTSSEMRRDDNLGWSVVTDEAGATDGTEETVCVVEDMGGRFLEVSP